MAYSLSPEVVWGLVPRFLGIVYVLAFAPLITQHEVMAGAHGLAPMRKLRQRVQHDFPGAYKYFAFPTTLWIADSDAAQRGMAILGTLCGLLAAYGGPLSPYALFVCWLFWLSLEPRGLVFPWDTMLQEAGFLALFLPSTEPLPSLVATTLPLPSVAFMVRWLVIRLMLGFAKRKFVNTSKDDFLFLRGFFVWMPLPTPLGWYAHHAPAWFLRGSLVFMFFAETVAPLLGFFTGPVRLVSFAMLVGLMAGIQVTGNWGFFNIGYALLCVCLLDTQSSLFDLADARWSASLTSFPDVLVHAVMLVLFLSSLFYLAFTNSWFSRSWVNWTPDLAAIPSDKLAKLWRVHGWFEPLRKLAPFRLVNGYGVFPPKALPPIRFAPVFEGSDDGVHWKRYGYRHMPSFANQRPPVIAPYHARLDQYAIYIPLGTDTGSMTGSLFPLANPYTIGSRVSMIHLLVQRILAHDPSILRMLGHNPFPDAPPKLVRVGLLALTPTRPSELRATGEWWHVRRIGTLFAPTGLASWPEKLLFPDPELFHPDLVAWKLRARPLRELSDAYARGLPLDEAVVAASDLTQDEVARFWSEFVPMLNEQRGDWTALHERAAAFKERYGMEGIYRFERLLERYAWLLRAKTEPHRVGQAEPALPTMSAFHQHMLLHEVITDGREAYEATLREPARLVARIETSTEATQLWTLAMCRYDQIMVHIRCFRTHDMGLKGVQGLPSFMEYHDFLVDQVPPEEEFRPQFVKLADGEFSSEGFYPPPPLVSPEGALPGKAS